MPPRLAYVDQASFHKLWSALPATRCDRTFWNGLAALWEPFLDERCPLRSGEYFTVPHTGRIQQEDLHFIDESVVSNGNDQRMLYDAFTMWNPFALAALLKLPIGVVVDQLLLAVEFHFVALRFVVSCRSCAFDLKHFSRVTEVPFRGTFHMTNAFRCPMCTDLTEVTTLSCVSVFFQLQRTHPVFHRLHHRCFVTEQAQKLRLETFFCPSGAGFALPLHLPRGKYLLCAPFLSSMVELDVQVSAAAFAEKDPFLPRIIDVKKFCVEPESTQPTTKSRIGAVYSASSPIGGSPFSPPHRGRRPMGGGAPPGSSPKTTGGPHSRQRQSVRASRGGHGSVTGGMLSRHVASVTEDRVTDGDGFGAQTVEEILPTQSLPLKHGKVQLRIYNTTSYSGFMDLYVLFDRRAEFSAVKYPKQFTLPDLLHCMPRGLRSRHLPVCTPLPPSETPTKGVFVRHAFDFEAGDYIDPEVLSVVREVHRYSLEDQHGLLLNVSSGGTSFESSFLSVTAAVASSICFFQRVLVRLGEGIAMSLRTSITQGPLLVAAYQGQYNDADNMRSAYPDVQFVGPVVYASNHPPVVPPTLYAFQFEAPTVPVPMQFRAGAGTAAVSEVATLNEFQAAMREEEFSRTTAIAAMAAAATAQQSTAEGRPPKSFMPWLDEGSDNGRPGPPATTISYASSASTPFGSAVGPVERHCNLRTRCRSEVNFSSTINVSGGVGGMGSVFDNRRWSNGTDPLRSVDLTTPAHTVTMARFELRSVRRTRAQGEITLQDLRAGSVPLNPDYALSRGTKGPFDFSSSSSSGSDTNDENDTTEANVDDNDTAKFNGSIETDENYCNFNTVSGAGTGGGGAGGACVDGTVAQKSQRKTEDDDVVLHFFLKYLVEQLEGTKIVEEPHALVIMVPLAAMLTSVQLSNMLDRSSYIKEYLGPF